MKRLKNENKKKIIFFLLFIVFVLLFIIITGTIAVFLKKNQQFNKLAKIESPADIRGKIALYTDIGRLRATTADTEIGTIVVFPVLEYNSKDKPFEEELVQKKEKIREVILYWFSNYKINEIYTMDEIDIKKELLEIINMNLNLSKVKKIYFKEFIILE